MVYVVTIYLFQYKALFTGRKYQKREENTKIPKNRKKNPKKGLE
jgi:hypothetical protein